MEQGKAQTVDFLKRLYLKRTKLRVVCKHIHLKLVATISRSQGEK